ncbi:MAG: hypothetical protein JWN70_6388 [Planctomycetaceae bacterium]|nr:hypothetical protein [Planctomycetaceae bacterium]
MTTTIEPVESEIIRTGGPAIPAVELSEGDQTIVRWARQLRPNETGQNALQQVLQFVLKRESQLRSGESGQRLATITRRVQTISNQLTEAKQEAEQAEAEHFSALGGNSDEAIESARTAVLAHHERVKLIESEVESMKEIHLSGRAGLGLAVIAERPQLHADIVSDACDRRAIALAAIHEAFEAAGLWEQFQTVAETQGVLQIVGSDDHAFQLACSDHHISQMFGRLRGVGHVSLSEFKDLDPKLFEGLRVHI